VCASQPSPEAFRIEPIFSPRIWGSRSLAPLFPDKTNLAEPIGEAWLTGVDCRIACGPFVGKKLGEAWREMPAEWRGSRLASCIDFPVLVKFIFPKDKLSIQVHPDDAYAAAHEQAAGGRGKTEMWHAVSAERGAQALIGLKAGVGKREFCDALNSDRLEELFETHPVQAGDTFFIPAGTPHTMGPGMVIFEVQEYSDLTYRVYDYGRVDANGKPREIHIEKALDVIKFGAPPLHAFRPDVPMDEIGASPVYYLAVCRHFAVQKWELDRLGARVTTEATRFELLIVLKGNGVLQWRGGEQSFKCGETWFLPAMLGECMLFPAGSEAEIMRILIPEDVTAFDLTMAKRGYPEGLRRQFIFPEAP
jgi:mannose-6-phosphate isomerase